MKKTAYFLSVALIMIFSVLILKNPTPCFNACAYGITVCGRVLIPSLYPFTFCVLFILNSKILSFKNRKFKVLQKLFGLDSYAFSVFLFSLTGGYPLGAKLINDSEIQEKSAKAMLNYCVNAGPAFIIVSVGKGIFGQTRIGVLLFVSHIIPSFIIALLSRKRITAAETQNNPPIGIVDNFVSSAASAASALINICSYVLLFSVITAYFKVYKSTFKLLKPLSYILEITNAVNSTNNVILISALLGFGGICVWCQVFSLSKKAKPDIRSFALYRIFHAVSSALITFLGIKIFKITVPAISNGRAFSFSAFTDTPAVGISLLIFAILLIISIANKNYAGNIKENIV